MDRNFYYRFCLIVLVFSHTLINSSFGQDRSKNKMGYLNLTPPGTEAEIFAQGIVSDPVLFSVLSGLKADCPIISPDDKKMLFNSSHPIDENDLNPSEKIWFIERIGNEWSTPKPLCLEINSDHLHWQVSIDLQGNVYFGSERSGSKGKDDIFVSRYIDGKYSHPISMSDSINTKLHESTPFIDPDGKYIIFSRAVKTRGYDQHDLYISYNKKDKGWTKAQNLGSKINSEFSEACPYISPDGQYLFFLRLAKGKSEIYWVRTKSIEHFSN